MAKVLFISHCAPPVPYSPSTLFQRLFKHFPVDSYVVMTSHLNHDVFKIEKSDKLPCPYYYAGGSIYGTYTNWSFIREWLEVVPMVARALSIIKKENINRILVHPTSGNFLLASCILNRLTSIPLYIYMLDLFTASHTYKIRKLMAVPIEKAVMKIAEKVFVMSESLQDFYKNKYNRETVLLRHPIELSPDSTLTSTKSIVSMSHKKTIVFTGMIYEAQLDALQNLVQVVNEMQNVEFHIYSQRTVPKLISLGLCGTNVIHHGYVDHFEILQIQRSADILFLPMAFNSPHPDIIKTASPGKLPEYLASGTPVLVHAPEYAYISWYARKYGWGLVVDKPDAELLRGAIRNILNNNALAEQLVKNASNTVLLHEESVVAGILKSHLGM